MSLGVSMEDWGAEYARMRQIIKGVHGALTDAGSVVVPGTLEGDLAPAIRQLTRERDDARAEAARHKRNAECYACEAGDPDMDGVQDTKLSRAEAEVARLEGLILDAFDRAGIQPTGPNESWLALLGEVTRIRSQREEGKPK